MRIIIIQSYSFSKAFYDLFRILVWLWAENVPRKHEFHTEIQVMESAVL